MTTADCVQISGRKLTKRVIDALPAEPPGERFVWDGGDGALKGFGAARSLAVLGAMLEWAASDKTSRPVWPARSTHCLNPRAIRST